MRWITKLSGFGQSETVTEYPIRATATRPASQSASCPLRQRRMTGEQSNSREYRNASQKDVLPGALTSRLTRNSILCLRRQQRHLLFASFSLITRRVIGSEAKKNYCETRDIVCCRRQVVYCALPRRTAQFADDVN